MIYALDRLFIGREGKEVWFCAYFFYTYFTVYIALGSLRGTVRDRRISLVKVDRWQIGDLTSVFNTQPKNRFPIFYFGGHTPCS